MNAARLRRLPLFVLSATAVCVLGACSSAVAGHGTEPTPGHGVTTSDSPDFPTTATPMTPAAPSSTAAATTSTPTLAQRVRALTARAGGDHVLVRVPDGYEATTYDQNGHIAFWHDPQTSTAWTQVGSSAYPAVAQLGSPDAKARGALLRGMSHATFIVHGLFTGDSSGNAVAFTTGPNGWGAIKAERDGDIGPSGRPVGSDRIGLSFEFAFHDGLLQTEDCPQNLPISDCGSHPVVKDWRWAGTDFHPA